MSKSKSKGFCPYSKPWPPTKPREEFEEHVEVGKIRLGNYDGMSTKELKEQLPESDYVSFEIDRDPYGDCDSITLIFSNRIKKKNPNYKRQLERYNEEYKNYRSQLKEWKEQKKLYDEEQARKNLECKKAMLKQLKEELGDN